MKCGIMIGDFLLKEEQVNGKYQLKSRKEGSVITLLEVDTECRAWYVKADDKDAAVKTLISMGESIRCWSPSTSTG